MKRDPYSDLSSLDQRLFQRDPIASANETAKQRTRERVRGGASVEPNARLNVPTFERAKVRTRDGPNDTTVKRPSEATGTPASSSTGQRPPVRLSERHSHDLYHDQIRWINRVKLDIEETYGRRITGNGIVQLAVDMVRRDYERKGEGSALVKALVHGEVEEER